MRETLTRRQFLQTLTLVGTATALVSWAGEGADASPAHFVPAGKVGEFPSGIWKLVRLPGGDAVHIRRLPGKTARFQALSAKCTHKGCIVAWAPGEKHFVCPCHNGKFDSGGKNVAGPPPAPLPTRPIRVMKGVVLVQA